jgi:hypothetical protein
MHVTLGRVRLTFVTTVTQQYEYMQMYKIGVYQLPILYGVGSSGDWL